MKHILKDWDRTGAILGGKKGVLLLLDYDGTLSPIAASPGLARLPRGTKRLLEVLKKNPFFTIAIISGRSLKEIKKQVGIKGIIYAGNHGLEMEGPGLKFVNKGALSRRRLLDEIYRDLSIRLSAIKGALIENKGLTLSVHYRLVKRRQLARLKIIVNRMLRAPLAAKKIRLTYGKKVYEIRPPVDWDKGKAVKRLLKDRRIFKKGMAPVSIGDDYTDEDMFRAVGPAGISICVGNPRRDSQAGYYLKDTKEVKSLLDKLAKIPC